MGGVNEVIAVYLLAAKFGVPVCPHAGGVGLAEYVQHLQMFDYISVSGLMADRVIEFTDHLHEHFIDPVRMENASYLAPQQPGYSAQMKADTLARFAYPHGEVWQEVSG